MPIRYINVLHYREDIYFCCMRYVFAFTILLLAGCSQRQQAKDKSLHEVVTGNWFVVYPDDKLLTQKQSAIYGEIQDSLTDSKCLKLISFTADGSFIQLDSSIHKGKWGTKDEEYVVISNGGNGFENFRATFTGYSDQDSVLKITETVKVKGENLRFIWNLKRLEEGYKGKLFDPGMNTWRKKPQAAETEEQLRQRLAQMLEFYAGYFRLISEEASYFMPVRIFMPIKFYQHAIGMKEFNADSRFTSFFYSDEDANKAYRLLSDALNNSDFDGIDGGNSYTKEYSQMLQAVAKTLTP